MQSSTLDNMIWSVAEIISHLSASVSLHAGDLILTGTPEGVGSVKSGDTIIGRVAGLPPIQVSYIDA